MTFFIVNAVPRDLILELIPFCNKSGRRKLYKFGAVYTCLVDKTPAQTEYYFGYDITGQRLMNLNGIVYRSPDEYEGQLKNPPTNQRVPGVVYSQQARSPRCYHY